METLILICLILIIILLLYDKVYPNKELGKPVKPTEQQISEEDILGRPKTSVLEPDPKNVPVASLEAGRNDQADVVEKENISASSETDDNPVVDYDEEEEEWRYHSYIQDDQGFAEGVTFEELQSLHDFVKNDRAVNTQSGQLLETAKKLQGTELFSLLESSVEGVSWKIAKLLDNTLDSVKSAQDNLQNSFDIQNYL